MQARSVVTRERLLDAAIECLIEHGYGGTSTTLVCQRAGLSRGAQLHHFATKDELLLAALEHLARRRFEEVTAKADTLFGRPRSSDVAEQIREGVDLLWTATFVDDLFFGALELWVAGRTDPGLQTEVQRVEHTLGRRVIELFRDLFPREISESAEGVAALRDVSYLLRGLALTRLLRSSSADEERVLGVCVKILTDAAARSQGFPTSEPSQERQNARNEGG